MEPSIYTIELAHRPIKQTSIPMSRKRIATRYPNDSKWQTLAAYLSHKYKPNSKLTVQSGIRYNYVTIDADLTENSAFYNLPFITADLETSALTGTLGLSWNPNATFFGN